MQARERAENAPLEELGAAQAAADLAAGGLGDAPRVDEHKRMNRQLPVCAHVRSRPVHEQPLYTLRRSTHVLPCRHPTTEGECECELVNCVCLARTGGRLLLLLQSTQGSADSKSKQHTHAICSNKRKCSVFNTRVDGARAVVDRIGTT
jgi:hypothetical protein